MVEGIDSIPILNYKIYYLNRKFISCYLSHISFFVILQFGRVSCATNNFVNIYPKNRNIWSIQCCICFRSQVFGILNNRTSKVLISNTVNNRTFILIINKLTCDLKNHDLCLVVLKITQFHLWRSAVFNQNQVTTY